ncbi:hypothetical protein C9926_00630 [Sulfurovum lithotrophicum]|nr:hypothetical protein C9926_00630 [Sulfurovum lithotrophicum]
MLKVNITSLFLMTSTLLLIQNCGSSKVPASQGGFTHSGIYFGKHFPAKYKQGIIDGCTTAKGNYKKSHRLFNTNTDYNSGWFLGRNRCRHLLVVEENKESK